MSTLCATGCLNMRISMINFTIQHFNVRHALISFPPSDGARTIFSHDQLLSSVLLRAKDCIPRTRIASSYVNDLDILQPRLLVLRGRKLYHQLREFLLVTPRRSLWFKENGSIQDPVQSPRGMSKTTRYVGTMSPMGRRFGYDFMSGFFDEKGGSRLIDEFPRANPPSFKDVLTGILEVILLCKIDYQRHVQKIENRFNYWYKTDLDPTSEAKFLWEGKKRTFEGSRSLKDIWQSRRDREAFYEMSSASALVRQKNVHRA